jgi:hypothetical protein
MTFLKETGTKRGNYRGLPGRHLQQGALEGGVTVLFNYRPLVTQSMDTEPASYQSWRKILEYRREL